MSKGEFSSLNLNPTIFKIGRYFLWIIFLLILLLLIWQITLITKAIKYELTGIDFSSIERRIIKHENGSTIPKVIHQMWKTKDLSTYPINTSHSQWKSFYLEFTMILWDDKDIEELIQEEQYKYLYEIYKAYPYSIQRSDLARLIILHKYGGIYADLDVFPLNRQIEELLETNASFIVPLSSTGFSLINHFFIAQKSSPILNFLLHEIFPFKFYERIYILPYLQVFATGSIFLTRTIQKYIHSTNNRGNSLLILSEKETANYIKHYQGRSWHEFDGFILNKLEFVSISLFSYLIPFIIFSFLLYKYSHRILKLNRFK